MELSKKQLEFWAVLLIIILSASVLIMLVDFGIKAAILEESTRLRLKIEEWEKGGRNPTKANASGASNDVAIDTPFPSDLLVVNPSRVEKGNVPNGTTKKAASPRRRQPKPNGPSGNREV